jgi:hypothetical protein
MDTLRLIGFLASLSLTGCGMLGVKEIDAWGLNMKFSEGLDYSIGFNQIDKVENKRGVNSFERGYGKN